MMPADLRAIGDRIRSRADRFVTGRDDIHEQRLLLQSAKIAQPRVGIALSLRNIRHESGLAND